MYFNNNMAEYEKFQIVDRRKRGKRIPGVISNNNIVENRTEPELDVDRFSRKLNEAKDDLNASEYVKTVFQDLSKSTGILNSPVINDLGRYGLCYFSEHFVSLIVIRDVIFSVSTTMNANLKVLRSLISEIRHTTREKKMKDNIMVQYILEQSRKHRETSEVLCKAREELKCLGETYLNYLESQRKYNEIRTHYAGRGERSVKETADLVGFKLPHDPK